MSSSFCSSYLWTVLLHFSDLLIFWEIWLDVLIFCFDWTVMETHQSLSSITGMCYFYFVVGMTIFSFYKIIFNWNYVIPNVLRFFRKYEKSFQYIRYEYVWLIGSSVIAFDIRYLQKLNSPSKKHECSSLLPTKCWKRYTSLFQKLSL